MNDNSRNQGWAICGGAVLLGFLFLAGILSGSYVALAIPVAVVTFFALGLVAWVGYTIATVRVEPELPFEPPAAPPPERAAEAESQQTSA